MPLTSDSLIIMTILIGTTAGIIVVIPIIGHLIDTRSLKGWQKHILGRCEVCESLKKHIE